MKRLMHANLRRPQLASACCLPLKFEGSLDMNERYIEIKFYYYIMKLLRKFKYSVHVLDILEAYCALGDIDVIVIKNLLRQIREDRAIISTYREEAVFIGRQANISYRQLQHDTGIAMSTQARLYETVKQRPEMYVGITKKLPDYEYEQVYKFMKLVDILKEL